MQLKFRGLEFYVKDSWDGNAGGQNAGNKVHKVSYIVIVLVKNK